jgi:hypothetical protein
MNATAEVGGANWEGRERLASPSWFVRSATVILAVTGVAKVWTAFAPMKLLAVADPIMGISFGHLMLVVGVVELVIASICLFGKSQTLKLGLIAWLATNFVVYRFGLWWMGWHKPCSCLGNLTDALHISPQLADNIMKVILAYLLLGSYGLLFLQWRKSGVAVPNNPAAPQVVQHS